jgi:hypothetical protein
VQRLVGVDAFLANRAEYVQRSAKGNIRIDARPTTPSVFISYSAQDEEWAQRLEVILRPVARSRDLELWSDQRIRAGESWRTELEDAIRRAAVIVLLVSADYLASEHIMNFELPIMIDQGVPIVPLLVGSSMWQATPIANYQVANSAPLATLRSAEVDKILVDAATRIAELANRAA